MARIMQSLDAPPTQLMGSGLCPVHGSGICPNREGLRAYDSGLRPEGSSLSADHDHDRLRANDSSPGMSCPGNCRLRVCDGIAPSLSIDRVDNDFKSELYRQYGKVYSAVNEAENSAASPKLRDVKPHLSALKLSMQRKMLGYLLHRVNLAQDSLGVLCGPDDTKRVSEEKKRWFVKITVAMQPWVRALLQVMNHAHSENLRKFFRPNVPDEIKSFDCGNDSIVYARISLDSNDMYIGETGNFAERTVGHYMKCLKHANDCRVNPCSACDEHAKYMKHRSAKPHRWMTVALKKCASMQERKRVEKWAIRKWKPNMNSVDIPFWRKKMNNYTREKEP